MRFPTLALLAPSLFAELCTARFVMYYDDWHQTRPTSATDRAGIDHVVLSFAMANNTATYQPKVPISTIRSEFPNAKVMIAIGGWGDTVGFSAAAKTPDSIAKFANDVQTMLQNTGADGIDIDWEYPGGNGADYKVVANSEKVYEVDAFPKLLAAVRSAIGKNKLLSIAVPGKKGDMIAYTSKTGPLIWPSVDYVNVMSYDLMNRRDTKTAHHTSVTGAAESIENYIAIGAPTDKINLGFAFYAKYFQTSGDCSGQPLGCAIVLAEDPVTGEDTLTSGAWTFEKSHLTPIDPSKITVSWDGTCGGDKMTKCASGCCSAYGYCGTAKDFCSGGCQHAFGTGCIDADVFGSWQLASANGGVYDRKAGGQYFFDPKESLFWTWDTPDIVSRKFRDIVHTYGIGGAMAWSLGEDSYDWSLIKRIASELKGSGYGNVDASIASAGEPVHAKGQADSNTDPVAYNSTDTAEPEDSSEDSEWEYYYYEEDSSAQDQAVDYQPQYEDSNDQYWDEYVDAPEPQAGAEYNTQDQSKAFDEFEYENKAIAEDDYDSQDGSQSDVGYSWWDSWFGSKK